MRYVLPLICTLLVACGSSTTGKPEMTSGADIGKNVSEKTRAAQKDDPDHVIIASSKDGEPEAAPAPADAEPKEPAVMIIRLSPAGEMMTDAGEPIGEVPSPTAGEAVSIVPAEGTPYEKVVQAMDALKSAGWTSITLSDESADAPESSAPESSAPAKETGEDAEGDSPE